MIDKQLILNDLQKQMREAEDSTVKVTIAAIISEIVGGTYDARIW